MNGPDSKLSVERVHTCPLYIDMRVLSSVGGGAAMAALLQLLRVCPSVGAVLSAAARANTFSAPFRL